MNDTLFLILSILRQSIENISTPHLPPVKQNLHVQYCRTHETELNL